MDLQLTGKVALVTGGSRGIGRATAARFAQEGAVVAIAARNVEVARATATSLTASTGSTIVSVQADMGLADDVRRLVDTVATMLGPISILVNNAATVAGRARPPVLADITRDALITEIDVKVLGYIHAAQGVAPGMKAQGWGRIINVAGLAALSTGSTIGSIRNVSVAALTKNLADELGPSGVGVTVVHPGLTITERSPGMFAAVAEREGVTAGEVEARFGAATSIGRLVTAEEVADVVVFLCSPRSVAITGDAVAAGGGAPGPIHY